MIMTDADPQNVVQRFLQQPIEHGWFFIFLAEHDVFCPISLILVRPHAVFRCGLATVQAGGKGLGNIFYKNPDLSSGANVNQKTATLHLTLYFRAKILDPSRIVVIPNIYTSAYQSGLGTNFNAYDYETQEAYQNQETVDDIFVLATYPTRRADQPDAFFDITGAFDPELVESERSRPHYPTAWIYSAYWGWRHSGRQPEHDTRGLEPPANTIVAQATQWDFVHKGGGTGAQNDLTVGCSCIGYPYPGSADVRSGRSHMLDTPSYHDNTTAALR